MMLFRRISFPPYWTHQEQQGRKTVEIGINGRSEPAASGLYKPTEDSDVMWVVLSVHAPGGGSG